MAPSIKGGKIAQMLAEAWNSKADDAMRVAKDALLEAGAEKTGTHSELQTLGSKDVKAGLKDALEHVMGQPTPNPIGRYTRQIQYANQEALEANTAKINERHGWAYPPNPAYPAVPESKMTKDPQRTSEYA